MDNEDMLKILDQITTVHEAIYDYNIANKEYKEKMEKLKKHHKSDMTVLKAVIRSRFKIGDGLPIYIDDTRETVEILFNNKIKYNIFKALENTGLQYEVVLVDDQMILIIFLNGEEMK